MVKILSAKTTDGLVSRYINRRISSRITAFILNHNIPVTPNQVSLIAFIMALIASILYYNGWLLLGGILVQLSSIIDGVDGELARARKIASARGAFLDTMLDRFADIAIYTGLALYLASQGMQSSIIVLVTALAISGDLMVSYMHAAGEAKLGRHPSLVGRIPPLASRDVRLFVIFVGTVCGFAFETMVAVAIISYIYVISKFIELTLRALG